jgi:formate dehydrogenase major subunit
MKKAANEPAEKIFSGVCRHCSGGCGALFTVTGGVLTAMAGDPAHPLSRGSLCAKAGHGNFGDRPGRLTRPLWRPAGDGEWREISWERALELLAARLKAARAAGWQGDHTEGVAIFGSACVTNEESYLLAKLARLLGTNYIEHQGRV